MRTVLVAALLTLATSMPALAQSSTFGGTDTFGSREGTIGELVAQGYEIKSAIVTSGKYYVFLQKGTSAYACEFTSLARSRCGEIK